MSSTHVSQPDVSIIIPTLNEEVLLPTAIESVRRYLAHRYPYEIIVVDHGSTDETVRIAESKNAKVLIKPGGTVASLRNFGARHARARVLIFLDADVALTERWAERFPHTFDILANEPLTITGSWVGISQPGSWIERIWFEPLVNEGTRHVNSGHLVTTKMMFDTVGGFDESLETGEDYDLSMRAMAAGAVVVNDPQLPVVHAGYPKTLLDFMRREIWHGKGDFILLRSILKSRVALISLSFMALHIVGVLTLWWNTKATLIMGGLIILLCLGSSVAKYRRQPLRWIIVNGFIYYWYYWARAISFLKVLSGLRKEKIPTKVRTSD